MCVEFLVQRFMLLDPWMWFNVFMLLSPVSGLGYFARIRRYFDLVDGVLCISMWNTYATADVHVYTSWRSLFKLLLCLAILVAVARYMYITV